MNTVERLARVLGAWMTSPDVVPNAAVGQLLMCPLSTGGHRLGIGTGRGRPLTVDVDEPTVLLALLAYARGLEVDLGPCPACENQRFEVRYGEDNLAAWDGFMSESGWRGAVVAISPGGKRHISWWRPCPACSVDAQPTGRDVRPLVRVLLDSTPRDAGKLPAGLSKVYVDSFEGDPASRDALAVKADELAQAGDPLAEPLAAFLGGDELLLGTFLDLVALAGAEIWKRTVECRACKGAREIMVAADTRLSAVAFDDEPRFEPARLVECEACNGEGRVLPQPSPARTPTAPRSPGSSPARRGS